MSVINKMLRDLDSRQAGATTPVQAPVLRGGLVRDTQVIRVSGTSGQPPGQRWLGMLMMALLVVGGSVAAAWWYINPGKPMSPVVKSEIAVAPVVAPAMVPPLPQPEASQPVADAAVLRRSPVALKMENLLRQVPQPETPPKPAVATVPRVAPERLPQDRVVKEKQPEPAQVAAVQSPVATTTIPISTSPPGTRIPVGTPSSASSSRPSPALEALAQGQALWNAGSRDAAMDLLREALALAERAPAGSPAALSSLARELARMELAEGRVSQALEMLTRLEPVLSGSADVWALRGNATQRLGRHQESAAAYLMALKLRPEEPRWMLGAAVSLAAQGQTTAAAELAEKARVAGVLSREVAAYLRQLGVPLRER